MADPKSTPTSDWLQIEAVNKQIERAAQVLAQVTYERYKEHVSSLLNLNHYIRVESPLEAMFWAWWTAVTWESTEPARWRLEIQREVIANGQPYRLDFVVSLADQSDAARFSDAGRPFPKIAVEVDGHAFHEKTKEQVAQRNRRDRDLQVDGWKVFHFSWTEIVNGGAEAAGDVLNYAMNEWITCDAAAIQKWYETHPEQREAIEEKLRAAREKLAE